MINKNTTKNKNIVKNKKLAPFYKKFELFDETWKDIPKYDCVVKFMLQPTPELLDFHRRTHKARIELNRYIYKELKNGKEVPQQFHNWLKDNNIKNILKFRNCATFIYIINITTVCCVISQNSFFEI